MELLCITFVIKFMAQSNIFNIFDDSSSSIFFICLNNTSFKKYNIVLIFLAAIKSMYFSNKNQNTTNTSIQNPSLS